MNQAEVAAAEYLFNLLNSSSSSSSDEDLVVRGPIENRPRIRNYIEDVVDNYSNDEFIQNFRMRRNTFNHILNLIQNHIASNIIDRGRHTINSRTQLLLALWYFATPDTYRSICGRFNVGKATGIRTVRRVTNALLQISNNIIIWPTGDYLNEVKNGFSQMGFMNVIGCIDGMHVPIPKPKDHGQSYINRKQFASLILQGICDHNLKFTHCYAGEVGANHDSTVLRRSEVWAYLQDVEKFPDDTHLLGDKAYPCVPQLMTPYKDNGHLNGDQKNFNFFLSRTRMTIERTFGLLQKRFRFLKDLLDVRSMNWAPKYIIACCVLHNICIIQNDLLELDVVVDEENDDNYNHNEVVGNDRQRHLQGKAKRNRLCQEINTPFV